MGTLVRRICCGASRSRVGLLPCALICLASERRLDLLDLLNRLDLLNWLGLLDRLGLLNRLGLGFGIEFFVPASSLNSVGRLAFW